MEIDPSRDVHHSTRLALRRTCRLDSPLSLANDVIRTASESGTPALGRMASLLHNAALSSAHVSVSIVSFVMVVSFRRSKLAQPFASFGFAFAGARQLLDLLHHRIFENRSCRLETWMDGRCQ